MAEDTLICLQSLLELNDDRLSTIVVCDNGSTDSSVQKIIAWAKCALGSHRITQTTLSDMGINSPKGDCRLFLIENQINMGYATGCNSGIRYALHRDFQFIWLLNNDTRVHPDSLTALLACADTNANAGIFGSTVVDFYQHDRVQCAGGCYYWPLATVFKYARSGRKLDDVISIPLKKGLDYIYGASMFIRSDVLKRVGVLNEDYFLFYEEIDFCHRAQSAGYLLKWCPQSIVSHQQSKSFKNLGTSKIRDRVANYHENLSTLIFTARFYPLSFPVACLSRFFGKLVKMAIYGNWHLLQPLILAYVDFFRGLTNGKYTLRVKLRHRVNPPLVF
jgi:GT2 family glycosyltransferase